MGKLSRMARNLQKKQNAGGLTEARNELQRLQFRMQDRDDTSSFYAATKQLWNVEGANSVEARNKLIVDKLGVSDLHEAKELVDSWAEELGDDSDDRYDEELIAAIQSRLARHRSELLTSE